MALDCHTDRLTRHTGLRLTFAVAGYFPVHAMRRPPPEAGNTHLQGQIAEHGQVGQCAS
jgi:hypothetical protein